ncbi:hypothetical protein NDA16_000476 [Ustilago loliicola]|nr:hypothetical protein NDA16_000476 [Ustilago loliicola]
MAITILTGIEDTLALIHECGSNLTRIESTLVPALRKLCTNTTSEGEPSRNTASSSRTRQSTSASELVLCEPIPGNVDPLTALDPAAHSVGMLYILAARATHAAASYFYYAALIYIKLDRLEDAIDALETCISSPAVAVSAIHMDAYKKLILVQLLAHGKTSQVPKYTPQVVTRTFKPLAQPYLAFVTAYESRDTKSTQELQRLIHEKRDAFEKIRKGWIHATLSPPPSASSASTVTGDWIVKFDPYGGDAYTSANSISLLKNKIKTAKQYQALLQQRDRDIEKSHAYLTRGLKIRDARTAGSEAYSGADDFDDADY